MPIYSIFLWLIFLKFKEKIEYKDGRETNLTGSEAFAIYGKIMEKHLEKIVSDLN